jgi:azurin
MRKASRALLLLAGFMLAALPALAAGNAKDLEGTPQAKAYRALIKAIDAQDFEAYKKCMVAEAAKDMDKQLKEMGKTPKEVMGFFKAMEPTDIKFTDLKVDGKKATLMATGKSDGEVNKGTIDLAEENGAWKIGKQSWTNAK